MNKVGFDFNCIVLNLLSSKLFTFQWSYHKIWQIYTHTNTCTHTCATVFPFAFAISLRTSLSMTLLVPQAVPLAPKRKVSCDNNALLHTKLSQLFLLPTRTHLHLGSSQNTRILSTQTRTQKHTHIPIDCFKTYLVDSRRNFWSGKQVLELFAGEIANAYGLGEAKPLTLFHSFPHGLKVHRKKILFIERKDMLPRFLQSNWPMD